MPTLEQLLEQSSDLHRHLCPRQVLGVRMGLWAGELLGISVPQPAKRLLTIVETDGCFTDGVSVATNCWVGRRTLRVEDYGKVAATFIDTATNHALRIAPHPLARDRAQAMAPEADNRWQAMLLAYQHMTAQEMFIAQPVELLFSVEALISRPGHRVTCDHCGEEILNEREVQMAGRLLCRSCAAGGYYRTIPENSCECDGERAELYGQNAWRSTTSLVQS